MKLVRDFPHHGRVGGRFAEAIRSSSLSGLLEDFAVLGVREVVNGGDTGCVKYLHGV